MSLLNKASLIQIPSGYKDGTLYSAKPTNGDGDFTFSRGSNLAATRVNSEGLIEKGRENLLLQSNTFDTTWSTVNASVTSGQSGYDGSSDAWLLEKSASAGYLRQNNASSNLQTYSIYAKSGTLNWVVLESVVIGNAYFDLQNGVVGNASASLIDKNIDSIGNGWYRVSITYNATISQVRLFPADSNGSVSGTSGNILIQDAQLELGLVATDYIETTTTTEQAGILEDMPRLDYSGGATCPSLLLEPQRTNSVVHSEYMSSSWWNATQVSVISNSAISPDGKQNASKIVETASTSTHLLSSTFMANQVGVVSVYAKAGERRYATISKNSGGSNYGTATFDLIDGVVTQENKTATAVPSIEDAGNGWYRLSVYFTTSAAGFFSIGLSNSATYTGSTIGFNSYAGDGTSGAYFWGAQCELNSASYPTSIIPTYGASVTRSADFSDNNDIVSSPISFGANDDFTLFYEGSFDDLSSGFNMIMGGGNQSSGNDYKNYWWLFNATSIRINGDSEVLMASASMSLTDDTNHKLLVKRDGSTIDFFVDGSKLTTTQSTPNTSFVFRSLGWSYTNSVYKVSGNIKQSLVFNSALTDAECIQLTTL